MKKVSETYNFRTDMAVECPSIQSFQGVNVESIEGIRGVTRTDVRITSSEAAVKLGKSMGSYVTIDSKNLHKRDIETRHYTARVIAKAIKDLLEEYNILNKTSVCALVVGLGNKGMTADSLGPKVCEKMIVTRHIYDSVSKEFSGKMQSLATVSPGVLGLTGIETYDIIKGVVDSIKPDVVITVDALSSKSTERISSAFQITDTGIVPGAGVENYRYSLDKKSLGVPVIAVGVPLVVYASTITLDMLEKYFEEFPNSRLKQKEADRLVSKVVTQYYGDLVVTPKDIDLIVKDCAYVLALAINLAVHNKLTLDDICDLIQ